MKRQYTNSDITLIETKVEEEVALRAEELHDTRAINDIRQDKSKWTATVVDKNIHFSVAVTLTGQQLKSCKCDCPVYAQTNICAHILTTIFEVRNRQQQAIEEKKTTKTVTRKRNVKISDLITQINESDLQQFVISKCRSDQNFKLHFQARFIDKIPSDRLADFVESTFPIFTKANEKVAPAKLRTFLDLTEELMQHFKLLMSQDNLIEAYHLIYLLLKKSFYIKYHLKNDNSRYFKMHKELLSNYQEVYSQIEAPEYKEQVSQQLIDLLSTSYISATLRLERAVWMILLDNTYLHESLQELVSNYLSKSHGEDFNSLYFVKMLKLVLINNEDEQRDTIMKKDMQECYRIIQYLIEYADNPYCNRAIIQLYLSGKLNQPLAKSCLEHITTNKDNREILIQQSLNYYKKHKDTNYLTYIQSISKKWAKDQKMIVAQLESWPDPALLIKYHIYQEDAAAAAAIIEQDLQLDNLKRYDQQLCEINEDICKQLYTDLLKTYLSDHFGIKAQDFVKTVLHRIRRIDQAQWIKTIKSDVGELLPDRKVFS